jgi:hypothetical protein
MYILFSENRYTLRNSKQFNVLKFVYFCEVQCAHVVFSLNRKKETLKEWPLSEVNLAGEHRLFEHTDSQVDDR